MTRNNPILWEKAKQRAYKEMGGHSARAIQKAIMYYKQDGGTYSGQKTKEAKSLIKWQNEDWRTKSGMPSKLTGERYLPAKAIKALTAKEYEATTKAKIKGTKEGKQYVKQPKVISNKVKKYRK